MTRTLRSSAHALFALALAFALIACGDSDSDSSPNNGETTPTDTTPTSGATTSGATTSGATTGPTDMCLAGTFDRVGMDTVIANVAQRDGGLEYTAYNADGTPFDVLYVITRDGAPNAPSGPATVSLDGSNLSDCAVCVVGLTGCEGGECEKTYFAREGEVDITKMDSASFAATLSNVVMEEAILDNGTSTPVENGETWCLSEHSFDENVITDATEARCAQPGVNCLGDTIPDFTLRNCIESGNFSFHEMGQDKKAIWVVLTASWCSACKQWLPQVIEVDNDLSDQGLEVVYIMGEDDNYDVPSRSECRTYVEDHYDTEVNRFFLDHNGEYSFATTFANMWPYINDDGSFGLPWNAVIDPRTMEFVYADGSGQPETLDQVLESLLSRD